MSKRLIWFLGLLSISGLVACRSTAAPTLEPLPSATPVAPTATPVAAPATNTATPRPTPKSANRSEPSSASEPRWQIPEVRESDWAQGAADAALVIVEYSDFQ